MKLTPQDFSRKFRPHHKAFVLSALHFMSTTQIAQTMNKDIEDVENYIAAIGGEAVATDKLREQFTEKNLKKWLYNKGKKQGKRGRRGNYIGRREDLGIFLRSRMEANFARILNLKYGKFEYESEWFTFKTKKRGPKKYLPDFKITDASGKEIYFEVKGYFASGDKTKLKRFIKEYPDKKIIMVSSSNKVVQKFCKDNNIEIWLYADLKAKYQDSISEWE